METANNITPEIVDKWYQKGLDYYYGRNNVHIDYKEAVNCMSQAVCHGHHMAQYYLAWMYEYGQGVEKSLSTAFRLYHDSALQGNSYAQKSLGDCCFYGKGVDKDYVEAVKWYKASAEKGNEGGLYCLAWMYENGYGVERDDILALQLYRQAADKGYAVAQYVIGESYYYGLRGVPKKQDEAVKWFQLAAEQGNRDGQYHLGICYQAGTVVEKNVAEAVKCFLLAAEQGHTTGALPNLLSHYVGGEVPVEYREKCMHCFRSYAEQGNIWVQRELAKIYERGIGVEKNVQESEKWSRMAAENVNAKPKSVVIDTSDIPTTLSDLDLCVKGDDYSLGRNGVEKNLSEAIRYYYKSAKQGFALAQNDLGNCFFYGKGTSVNYREAASWYRKAANQGYLYAQYNLGFAYENGQGVEMNLVEAKKWYGLAAEQGHENAKEKLKGL